MTRPFAFIENHFLFFVGVNGLCWKLCKEYKWEVILICEKGDLDAEYVNGKWVTIWFPYGAVIVGQGVAR